MQGVGGLDKVIYASHALTLVTILAFDIPPVPEIILLSTSLVCFPYAPNSAGKIAKRAITKRSHLVKTSCAILDGTVQPIKSSKWSTE